MSPRYELRAMGGSRNTGLIAEATVWETVDLDLG